jgi:prevent-host-death family protein
MGVEIAIKDAKSRLSELGRLVDAGERVIITKNGKPAYELKPVKRGGIDFDAIRRHIAEHGPIVTHVAPDFDAPLGDDFWFPKA